MRVIFNNRTTTPADRIEAAIIPAGPFADTRFRLMCGATELDFSEAETQQAVEQLASQLSKHRQRVNEGWYTEVTNSVKEEQGGYRNP